MKKIIVFFALAVSIGFISCDTLTRYTVKVSMDSPTLDSNPTLTIVNQTGFPVAVTAPVSSSVADGRSTQTQYQPTDTNRSIDVTYRIGQMQLTEQVTVSNQDVTVTLTRRPPTLTIVNNVGATIITIFLRVPNTAEWMGGNIVTSGGQVLLRRGATTTELTGSIVNRDSMRIWMGNLGDNIALSGDRFDIRIDDVQGSTYVKNNVQITGDMTLTFTQSDKR